MTRCKDKLCRLANILYVSICWYEITWKTVGTGWGSLPCALRQQRRPMEWGAIGCRELPYWCLLDSPVLWCISGFHTGELFNWHAINTRAARVV